MDAENKDPLVGAQFPLSKPVVALHAASAYGASTYLVSAFLAHSALFFPNFSNPEEWHVY